MLRMANRAYLSVWSRDFTEATMFDQFAALLGSVPPSAERPGIESLVVRAVDPGQPIVLDAVLHGEDLDLARICDLVGEQAHADSAYEVALLWDLWQWEPANDGWRLQPQRLEIVCYGEDYDHGAWREAGHFSAEIGFEHLFTGHARLLGVGAQPNNGSGEHPAETEFLRRMSEPARLREYQQKTQENIRRLFEWTENIQKALPVERYRLWSEGEENLEVRLDEILAVH